MSMKPECDSKEYWVYHNAWCFVSVQQLVGATTVVGFFHYFDNSLLASESLSSTTFCKRHI